MSKVSYANLKLKVDTSIKTFHFNGVEIEVLKYLPIEDKCNLIEGCLKKAETAGVYNPLILDMYFHLYMVYLYSNLSFTDKQKEDEGKIYNCLKSSGFMDHFLDAMDENEYNELLSMLSDFKTDILLYKQSTAAIINKFVDDIPVAMETASKIIESFNPEQYERLMNFAKDAGHR